jgi:hypothetical protein
MTHIGEKFPLCLVCLFGGFQSAFLGNVCDKPLRNTEIRIIRINFNDPASFPHPTDTAIFVNPSERCFQRLSDIEGLFVRLHQRFSIIGMNKVKKSNVFIVDQIFRFVTGQFFDPDADVGHRVVRCIVRASECHSGQVGNERFHLPLTFPAAGCFHSECDKVGDRASEQLLVGSPVPGQTRVFNTNHTKESTADVNGAIK